jgi:hypothetical protein
MEHICVLYVCKREYISKISTGVLKPEFVQIICKIQIHSLQRTQRNSITKPNGKENSLCLM